MEKINMEDDKLYQGQHCSVLLDRWRHGVVIEEVSPGEYRVEIQDTGPPGVEIFNVVVALREQITKLVKT